MLIVSKYITRVTESETILQKIEVKTQKDIFKGHLRKHHVSSPQFSSTVYTKSCDIFKIFKKAAALFFAISLEIREYFPNCQKN